MDDLLDKSCDLSLNLAVVRVVYDFPVIFLFIKHSVNSENGNNFLRVAMDVLLEIYETVLYSSFKRLCKLFVEFFQEIKPLSLDMLLAGQEELFVSSDKLASDDLEVVFECLLLKLHVRLLLVHELLKFVKLTLLDVCQD